MHIVIELWRPTQAWLDLSEAERKDVMAKLDGTMAEFAANGVKPLAMGTTDKGVDWAFYTVWFLPSIEQKRLFDFDRGPVDFFEQVYFTGPQQNPDEMVAAMLAV